MWFFVSFIKTVKLLPVVRYTVPFDSNSSFESVSSSDDVAEKIVEDNERSTAVFNFSLMQAESSGIVSKTDTNSDCQLNDVIPKGNSQGKKIESRKLYQQRIVHPIYRHVLYW